MTCGHTEELVKFPAQTGDIDNSQMSNESRGWGSTTGNRGNPLPCGSFLTTQKLFELLTSHYEKNKLCKGIPKGSKNNVYFVLNDQKNFQKTKAETIRTYVDDCRAWETIWTEHYYIKTEGKFKYTEESKDCFGFRTNIDGDSFFQPIKPQPTEENIFKLIRYYAKLKADKSYSRRVSTIRNGDELFSTGVAIVEYKGTFRGHTPHGNATSDLSSIYIRTEGETWKKIREAGLLSAPKQLYISLQNNTDHQNIEKKPRNLRQIYGYRYREKNKLSTMHGLTAMNHVEEVQQVIMMCNEGCKSFVRKIFITSGKPASFVAFTDNQIRDLRRFCCSGQTVLGVDKTFNLSKAWVTATVFKHLAVLSRATGLHPVFIGPLFIQY